MYGLNWTNQSCGKISSRSLPIFSGVDPAGPARAAAAASDGAAGRCGLALEAGLWGFHSAAWISWQKMLMFWFCSGIFFVCFLFVVLFCQGVAHVDFDVLLFRWCWVRSQAMPCVAPWQYGESLGIHQGLVPSLVSSKKRGHWEERESLEANPGSDWRWKGSPLQLAGMVKVREIQGKSYGYSGDS